MATIFFDQPQARIQLLPLTYTRPISEIRIGILKISEKWNFFIKGKKSWLTDEYLSDKYPYEPDAENLFINGGLCPTVELVKEIKDLPSDTVLISDTFILAFRTRLQLTFDTLASIVGNFSVCQSNASAFLVTKPWDIFRNNGEQIKADIKLIAPSSHSINDVHTIVYNSENVFVEEGVKIRAAILNAENGPIYLGKNSEVKEGAIIRGPFALCENSVINMGARLVGDNTIGPFSKVGGEVSNTVIQGFTNKSHEGFLGNSVIGEWCNIGADTNTSNLKNNYAKVKLWDYSTESFESTGLQFCGLIMGDHAKCGINTMFNTGTVVGVGANVFGEGFPRNYIPSFAWGGSKGYSTFRLDKFLEMTEVVMQRRQKELDKIDLKILEHIYKITSKHRFWENK